MADKAAEKALQSIENEDEFEEFEIEGTTCAVLICHCVSGVPGSFPDQRTPITLSRTCADWDESQEDPANVQLWEQDWDDDNVDEDFAQKLRAELAKNSS